jgi:hypothetical protein
LNSEQTIRSDSGDFHPPDAHSFTKRTVILILILILILIAMSHLFDDEKPEVYRASLLVGLINANPGYRLHEDSSE